MCCLFGFIDYEHSLSVGEKNRLINSLARASEARGTDAAGIAYNSHGHLTVYKRPLPAHEMKFRIPEGADVVMGHTRLTTQGDEKFNANNHPFKGMAGTIQFALAHNGVLYNDEMIRRLEHLPKTPILTDSYVAVQLIEKEGDVNFETLRNMAEQLEGSFTITVMDGSNNVYFIKGDNPMCIAHLPKIGAYVYASTEEILLDGIKRSHLDLGERIKVQLVCGEIMRIDSQGKRETERFDTDNLFFGSGCYRFGYGTSYDPNVKHKKTSDTDAYVADLKCTATYLGYSPSFVDYLMREGYSFVDIEEVLYDESCR